MKAAKKENNTDTVNAFMMALEHPLKAEIEEVRRIILAANDKIAERVKWTAPSFYYKEDLGAFHVRQEEFVHLMLVFPRGLITHESGLLKGNYTDRRMAYFYNMEDIESKKTALENIVNEWVKLIDAKVVET